MIELYTAATPNGFKISIALEELGLPYEVHPVDLRSGDQFKPEFLRISPNNKIPAIVDREAGDLAIFESGAILLYLTEKTGRLIPHGLAERHAALSWLFFQVGGTGPMFGQAHHFQNYAPEKIPYAIERYTSEAKRLLGVVDRQLAASRYLAGSEYTIADIANFPWISDPSRLGIEPADFPNLRRWAEELKARPAVQRGLVVPPRTEPRPT